jgi:DNA-3-methyladenine glycosylase II
LVDYWDGKHYSRVLIVDGAPVKIEASQIPGESSIQVIAKSEQPLSDLEPKISETVSLMLGLQEELSLFYKLAKKNPNLNSLVLKFKGVKPPCYPTLFEALVNAITFQQFSLESGFSLLNKLSAKYGTLFKEGSESYFSFPEPSSITQCSVQDLMPLGFSRHKAEALLLIASIMSSNDPVLNQHFLKQLPDEEVIELLSSIKGIGRWSAEYVLLRGLSRINILPGDDVGILHNIKSIFRLKKDPNFSRIKKIESEYYPYAGMIYFHILLDKLSAKGII